METFKAYLG